MDFSFFCGSEIEPSYKLFYLVQNRQQTFEITELLQFTLQLPSHPTHSVTFVKYIMFEDGSLNLTNSAL